MTARLQWQTPTVEPLWQTPTVTPFRLFSIDQHRMAVEMEALRKSTRGVHDDDWFEAKHRCYIKLLDEGHEPSRRMRRWIVSELKTALWPQDSPSKQRMRRKEAEWLLWQRHEIKYLAYKHRDAPNPQTKAEEKFEEMHNLKVEAQRKRLRRWPARVKKRDAAVERQRNRPLRKE